MPFQPALVHLGHKCEEEQWTRGDPEDPWFLSEKLLPEEDHELNGYPDSRLCPRSHASQYLQGLGKSFEPVE